MSPEILMIPRTTMELRVLSVLASRKSGWVTRDEIIADIYAEREPENADACVRVFLSKLRGRAPDFGFRIETINRSEGGVRRQSRYRLVEASHGRG
ncbi:MAG: helix-turn-helix domain-containing protein [Rhodobiaceae bacterium]|nr:helix-turn-helix domain-containing protein [Rhodobiaceae bacterium]MCC0051827.1 helix-turn-helix domain-containing protein [Rhodobiaceae bacterium]